MFKDGVEQSAVGVAAGVPHNQHLERCSRQEVKQIAVIPCFNVQTAKKFSNLESHLLQISRYLLLVFLHVGGDLGEGVALFSTDFSDGVGVIAVR